MFICCWFSNIKCLQGNHWCICLSLKLSASILAVKHNHYTTQGLWVIVGLLVFLLLEKMFPDQESQEDSTSDSDLNFNSAVSIEPKVVNYENLHIVIKVIWESCFSFPPWIQLWLSATLSANMFLANQILF